MLNELSTERITPALRFLTHEARVSQEKLATKVGMSTSAVTRRLSGDVPISLDDLQRFTDALGYDVQITLVPRPASERAA